MPKWALALPLNDPPPTTLSQGRAHVPTTQHQRLTPENAHDARENRHAPTGASPTQLPCRPLCA